MTLSELQAQALTDEELKAIREYHERLIKGNVWAAEDLIKYGARFLATIDAKDWLLGEKDDALKSLPVGPHAQSSDGEGGTIPCSDERLGEEWRMEHCPRCIRNAALALTVEDYPGGCTCTAPPPQPCGPRCKYPYTDCCGTTAACCRGGEGEKWTG